MDKFNEWVAQEYKDLAPDSVDDFWARAYTEEGYMKGQGRAFDDTRKIGLVSEENLQFYEGSKTEFLRSAFNSPVSIEKVRLLAGRTLHDLRGVGVALGTAMSRELTDGLIRGESPRVVGAKLNKMVDGYKNRGLTIARTETLRAHNEGQLDALEKLGVEEIGVMVEWSTAGDDKVCPLCQDLEAIVITIKEARSIIPRHPNCRCVYIPANVGENLVPRRKVYFKDPKTGKIDTKGTRIPQKRGKAAVEKAKNDSIRSEMPKKKRRTFAEQKARSRWAGADMKVSKVRPQSMFERGKPSAVTPKVPEKFVPKDVFAGKPANPAGKTSHDMFRLADGSWTAERQSLHNEIIADYLKGVEAVENPKAFMMGGGPASGKSSVLDAGHIKMPKNTLAVDSDKIKGYLPEYIKGVADGDVGAAAFAHEESSYLGKKILGEAAKRKSNVLLDGTGDNNIDNLRKKIKMIKSGGQKVEAHYMTMDTELSVKIEKARAAKTGRKVPESFLRNTHAAVSDVVPKAIKEGLFDEITIWDNNIKGHPIKIASAQGKKLIVHDKARWEKFLAKADEMKPKIKASVVTPKTPKVTVDTKTAKLQQELAEKKAANDKLKKELAETKAKTKAAEKQLADANKKAAKEAADHVKEVEKLKKAIREVEPPTASAARKELLSKADKLSNKLGQLVSERTKAYGKINEYTKKYQDLLEKQYRLRKIGPNAPGLAEINAKIKALDLEMDTLKISSKIDDLDKAIEKEKFLHQRITEKVLSVDPKKRIACHVEYSKKKIMRSDLNGDLITTVVRDKPDARLQDAKRFLQNITSKNIGAEVVKVEVNVMPGARRAFHSKGDHIGSGVFVGEKSGTSTYVHEIAHRIESELPDVKAKCSAFQKMRIERSGKPSVNLLEKFPDSNYGASEVGNPDDWEKLFGEKNAHYVGKSYADGQSELLSMGLQKLYEDPEAFAYKDPEFFDFLVGLLRGEI